MTNHPYPGPGHIDPAPPERHPMPQSVRTLLAVFVALLTIGVALVAALAIGSAFAAVSDTPPGQANGGAIFFALLVFVGLMILGMKGAEAIKNSGPDDAES